jgi:hypothetical protein
VLRVLVEGVHEVWPMSKPQLLPAQEAETAPPRENSPD